MSLDSLGKITNLVEVRKERKHFRSCFEDNCTLADDWRHCTRQFGHKHQDKDLDICCLCMHDRVDNRYWWRIQDDNRCKDCPDIRAGKCKHRHCKRYLDHRAMDCKDLAVWELKKLFYIETFQFWSVIVIGCIHYWNGSFLRDGGGGRG